MGSGFAFVTRAVTGIVIGSASVGALAQSTPALPPFPPDAPADWVCAESPPSPSPQEIAAWCAANPNRGKPAQLVAQPAQMSSLDSKNRFDVELRTFLRERAYRSLGWIS